MFRLRIPGALVLELRDANLPPDWRARPRSEGARRIGDAWVRSRSSVALAVPSVIVPEERNYLLNPAHPRFGEVAIDEGEGFRFDGRLAG